MKILFIGKRFYTNRDALKEGYGRIFKLPFHWQSMGENVDLWLVDYHGKDSVDKIDDNGLVITSTPLRSWHFFKHLVSTAIRRKARADIIVASGDCYIGFMGWLLAKWLGVKFVFDIYDRYDTFSGYKKIFGFDLLYFLHKNADACLFASRVVPESLGGLRKTDFIVANGVDVDHFRPMDKVVCRQQMNLLSDSVLVGYFGSMESDRGVDDLLEAVKLLRDTGLDIQLVLAGLGGNEANFDRDYVRYLGNVPYHDMPIVLGCCDVLALPYRRSTIMDAGASNKIIEYIAVSRPIAATRTPNLLKNFVAEGGYTGYLAEPFNPQSLAKCIEDTLKKPIHLPIPKGYIWSDVASSSLSQLHNV